MTQQDLFASFADNGIVQIDGTEIPIADIPWTAHASFEGVELKHLLVAEQTAGRFSYHLVRVAPQKSIGSHVHASQLETHEVIAGEGECICDEVSIHYRPGVIACLEKAHPHEVQAGDAGLYLFAKFVPALC